MNLPNPPVDATPREVVLGIDVGAARVHHGFIGPGARHVDDLATLDHDGDWNVERLCGIAADLYDRARAADLEPANLTVNANGQVDEYHGAVQHSPNLPWHDVAVKARVGEAVPCEVFVRHSVRAAVLAETNLGAARTDGGVLFISLGLDIIAAGASAGVVVADHVGAGDIAGIRIRSGPGQGRTLGEFASGEAIATRYAGLTDADAAGCTAADVHARIGSDPVARRVWDEAMEALADGLEWATVLFAPDTLVLGGGMASAGTDLLDPVAQGVRRRFPAGAAPTVRLATFGSHAGLMGALLTGWKNARFPVPQLERIVAAAGDGSDPDRTGR